MQGLKLRADQVDSFSHFLTLSKLSFATDPTAETTRQNIAPPCGLLNQRLSFTLCEISCLSVLFTIP